MDFSVIKQMLEVLQGIQHLIGEIVEIVKLAPGAVAYGAQWTGAVTADLFFTVFFAYAQRLMMLLLGIWKPRGQ